MVRNAATLAAVVCEDDAALAAALVDTLHGLYGFDVVASVECGDDAVSAVAAAAPDVVVVDLALAGEAGLGVVPALRAAAPECAVVVIVPDGFAALRAPAHAFGAMALVEQGDLRPLRRCLEALHVRAHADACPSCPATRPASTAAASDPARSRVRIHASEVGGPEIDTATGAPPSSTARG